MKQIKYFFNITAAFFTKTKVLLLISFRRNNMKAKKYFCNIFFLLTALIILPSYVAALDFIEPKMIDYTNYPLFLQSGNVKPNISIVLDNGNNMSENAYGTFPGDELIVPESYHGGDSYMGIRRITPLNGSDDAWMVYTHENTYEDTSNTLPLGYHYNPDKPDEKHGTMVGIRFDNVEIPRGRTIKNAWIEFMPAEDSADSLLFWILGQAADDPGTFTDSSDLESLYPNNLTTNVTPWNPGAWETNNPDNATTPDLKLIVQELVDRDGWESGNAMVFLIAGSMGRGKRVAHSRDSDEGFSVCTTDMCNKRVPITGGSAPVLHIEFEPDPDGADRTRYYGLYSKGDWVPDNASGVFEPVYYKQNPNEFIRCDKEGSGGCVDNERWHGNFLNWLTMRKIDIGMAALMGGFGTSRSTNNTHTARAQSDNALVDYGFYKWHDSDNKTQVSPYHGKYLYKIENGTFSVFDEDGVPLKTGISIVIDVDKEQDTERLLHVQNDLNDDGDFDDPGEDYVALNGIFEQLGSRANWSFSQFNKTYDGGDFKRTLEGWDKINPSWLTAMQNFQMQDVPPTLAEMHWLHTSYYMQDESILGNEDGDNGYFPGSIYGATHDPFRFTGEEIACPKNFVLYITTGGSESDGALPSNLIDYDDDDVEPASINQSFDDLTLYARTNDLRPELTGEQNLITYVVYAFGNDDDDRKLLMNAAKQGGFDEKGGRENFPDLDKEWDVKPVDGIPDTYFEASGGDSLQEKIRLALEAMLDRASSGTALSVLTTKRGGGEGTITQASFRPTVDSGDDEILWGGYLQMLWIDSFGNIREDIGTGTKLDIKQDPVVRFFLDTAGINKLYRFTPTNNEPYPTDNSTWEEDDIENLSPLWEAGEILSRMDSGDRNIFTNITDNSTIDFNIGNALTLAPYLGVEDDETWRTGAGLGFTEENRVNNIINFIRGADESEYTGDPSIRLKKDDNDNILKLGDIINSTPVSVSSPDAGFDRTYNDGSYRKYYKRHINRETFVYVGANDGMLHAFTAGEYNRAEAQFDPVDGEIGSESWAYIPRSLLPHLKWLPQEGYTHVSYVDLSFQILDAKIFEDADHDNSDNGTYSGGWGTVLLGGLNLGGKYIETRNAGKSLEGKYSDAPNAGYFKPSVFAIDVTVPSEPKFLWEKSFDTCDPLRKIGDDDGLPDEDLGFSTNIPTDFRVGGEFKLVYTSGPTDFGDNEDGEFEVSSDQNACVYIVEMETGKVEKNYIVGEYDFNDFNDSYFASPVAVDKAQNYNVDSIYMGLTYGADTVKEPREGAIFKITVPQKGDTFEDNYDGLTQEKIDDLYKSNASLWTDNFKLFALAPEPITTSFNMSVDGDQNVWIYGGTGRFMDLSDKADEEQNYLFGIKDPFFNNKYDPDNPSNTEGLSGYLDYAAESAIAPISIYPDDKQLFNANPYTINSDEAVADPDVDKVTGGDGFNTWAGLLAEARKDTYDGWYRNLCEGSISATADNNCNTTGPSERSITEPTILSGIVLYPTFSPSSDICGFGGDGRLWALYYETGTAYWKRIFGNPDQDPIEYALYLGSGISSAFGLHIGKQDGATVFTQMSTGTIISIQTSLSLPEIQPTYWRIESE
jgi:type IV pilus assembly protein PilY1